MHAEKKPEPQAPPQAMGSPRATQLPTTPASEVASSTTPAMNITTSSVDSQPVQVNVAQAMSDAELLARTEELRREQRAILASFPDEYEPEDDGSDY